MVERLPMSTITIIILFDDDKATKQPTNKRVLRKREIK
jgi:hypothetical protein